jgi:hypothetical protein
MTGLVLLPTPYGEGRGGCRQRSQYVRGSRLQLPIPVELIAEEVGDYDAVRGRLADKAGQVRLVDFKDSATPGD